MTNTNSRKLTIRSQSAACDNVDACDTVTTETLTACNGGVMVAVTVVGIIDGSHVNERSSTFYAGVAFAAAVQGRIRRGYSVTV